jgi:hypothetical protein
LRSPARSSPDFPRFRPGRPCAVSRQA